MDWHPTTDDLVLHYYGESPADEGVRVGGHLDGCATCRGTWQELTDTLRLVNGAAVPEPPADFEQTMWQRVSRQLPVRPHRASWRPFAIVGALAAGLVAAVATGYLTTKVMAPSRAGRDAASSAAREVVPATSSRERVLLTALNDHFSQTEVLLVELLNHSDSSSSDLAFEREAADDLVASGRLYRQTARQTGDGQFAQLLDDLEGVLVEVASSPERVNREDFRLLRARIDDEGLLFKVRAVSTEVRDRQQTLMTEQ